MDITDRVFLEKTLVQQEKLKTLDDISAEMAHEVRNPLTSIAGFARRLEKKAPETPEVGIILRESVRLEKLFNRIRDYLKPVKVNHRPCAVNVLLADSQLMTVHVVSPDGELLPALGRQGEGPGEVTRLGGVAPLPDGTVGLVQLMPGQVVKVDQEGLPAGTLIPTWPEAGGRLMLQEMQVAGSTLVASGRRMTRGDQGPVIVQWIAGIAPDGTLDPFYYRHETGRDFTAGVLREADTDWPGAGRWAALPDGRVLVAPERTEYRLDLLDRDGVASSFGRRFTTRPRSDQEKAAVEARFTQFRRGRGGNRPAGLTVEVLPHAADIEQIIPRPDGEIWIRTSRSHLDQPTGVMLTYDVFDTGGNFKRQLAVECEGVAPRDLLIPLADGSFVLIKGHADALAAMRGMESDDTAADDDIALEVVGLRPAPR